MSPYRCPPNTKLPSTTQPSRRYQTVAIPLPTKHKQNWTPVPNSFPFWTSQQSTGHHADALSIAHLYRRTSGHRVDIFSAVNTLSTPVIINLAPLNTPTLPLFSPQTLGLKIFAVVQTAYSLYSATLCWWATVGLAWLQFHFTCCSTSGFVQLGACRNSKYCEKMRIE